jgi:hypothetical protein
MVARRSVTVAAGVSAAFLASSTAFAISNGVFGAGRAERVGTFRPIEARLAPARSILGPSPRAAISRGRSEPDETPPPTTTATARPPASVSANSSRIVAATAAPTTHSTASSVPAADQHDDNGSADDGLELDD